MNIESISSDPIPGKPVSSITNKLLTIKLAKNDANTLVVLLSSRAAQILRAIAIEDRIYSPRDEVRSAFLAETNRMTRMCYELSLHQELRDLSLEDVLVLCQLELNSNTEFIHKILNFVKPGIRKSGVDDILEGHRAAKYIQTIMDQ